MEWGTVQGRRVQESSSQDVLPTAQFISQPGRSSVLIVVARPGDTIQVSPRSTIDGAGQVLRDWTTEPAPDAAATIDLSTIEQAGVRARVLRGQEVFDVPLSHNGAAGSTWTDEAVAAAARGPHINQTPDPELAQALLTPLPDMGYRVSELRPTVLHTTRLTSAAGQAMVLSVGLPSGALAVIGGHGTFDDQGHLANSQLNLLTLYPVGVGVDDLLVIMRCLDDRMGLDDLVMYGPSETVQFRLSGGAFGPVTGGGESRRTLRGSPAAGITQVEALNDDGDVLAEGPIGEIADLSGNG